MSFQSQPEIIFHIQPTLYTPRGKNILLKELHGHIKGTGETKFPNVHIKNACGVLYLLVEPVYAEEETLLHHYRLVKYDQLKMGIPLSSDIMDPLWYKLDKENNYTIDLQIVVMPPGDEYKREGVDKLKKGNKELILSCKLYASYEDGKNGENLIATKYSNPLKNKNQRLTNNKLNPEGSVDGGTEITLPFSPDLPNISYEVLFSNKKEKFRAYGEILDPENCSKFMRVRTPPYKSKDITEPVKISVHVVKVSDALLSKAYYFHYTPRKIEIPNFSSDEISQDEKTTIENMIYTQKYTNEDINDSKYLETLIACPRISIPKEHVLTEEYVKRNMKVRFSEKNNEYTDIEIEQFIPTVLLILKTAPNFYEKFGNDATIQIYNKLCKTLSGKFKIEFPKLETEKNIAKKRSVPDNQQLPSDTKKQKTSMDSTASTSTDLTVQFQNDPNEQRQSIENQQITDSETNTNPDNCEDILSDLVDKDEDDLLNMPGMSEFVKIFVNIIRLNGIILCG